MSLPLPTGHTNDVDALPDEEVRRRISDYNVLSIDLFPGARERRGKGDENMNDENYNAVKSDFIMALRIIYREGLSDAFAHLSARSNDGNEMMFMPRKSPALVEATNCSSSTSKNRCRSLPCTRRSTKFVPMSKRFFIFTRRRWFC